MNENRENLIPDFNQKTAFMKQFAADFEQATRYEEIASSVPEYIKIYREFDANGLIELNDRKLFFIHCISAKPVVYRYTGAVTMELFIEQFEKTLPLMGEQAFDWVMAMARDFNGGGGCFEELMSNMAKCEDSRVTNWEIIDEYVCRKALSMGWNGSYPDGSVFTPNDKNTLESFRQQPLRKVSAPSQPKQSYNDYGKSSSGGGGCYVATAVYGSYDCPEVWTLLRFRDFSLAESAAGRVFIKLYYAVSPTLVRWFGETSWFQRFWKRRLDRLVARLHRRGFEDTPYKD